MIDDWLLVTMEECSGGQGYRDANDLFVAYCKWLMNDYWLLWRNAVGGRETEMLMICL